MFNKYYQDELAYLRELGREYAQAHPEAARFLGEGGADPDVERLLEGFAFLTGRIRQKLDDELPELTRTLMELFFPQYLRQIPSMAILQVEPRTGVAAPPEGLPAGSYIDSVPVDGCRCRFRTTADLRPVAARIDGVHLDDATPPRLKFRLAGLESGAPVSDAPLRLHLSGDAAVTRPLFMALCDRVQKVLVNGRECPEVRLRPAGLGAEHGLLPAAERAPPTTRLLQEYMSFPAAFMFVDIEGLPPLSRGGEVVCQLRSLPKGMPPVATSNLQLNCVPVINLFESDADPIRLREARREYRIRPADLDLSQVEVYAVSQVSGRVRGSGDLVQFEPFHNFHHSARSAGHSYEVRTVEATGQEGSEQALILGHADEQSSVDVLSLELVCTNRRLPERLGPGDIREPASGTPMSYEYKNLTRPTTPVAAPAGDQLHWRFLANLSLSFQSLAQLDVLRDLVRTYDFRSRSDRQARRVRDNRVEAMVGVRATRDTWLRDGMVLRGVCLELQIEEEKFGGEGEVYLFGTVLHEFLARAASLNSFARLRIELLDAVETLSWPARLGHEVLL